MKRQNLTETKEKRLAAEARAMGLTSQQKTQQETRLRIRARVLRRILEERAQDTARETENTFS